MVTLKKVLERLDAKALYGGDRLDRQIGRITSDSRKVTNGTLFIAVRGYETDGHGFIDEAVAKGADAVVCEQLPESLDGAATFIVVPDSREAMARIAKVYYRDASDRLRIIGVTGTNGKTTTARVMASMMNDCGIMTGYIGTGLALAGDEAFSLERTTPEAEELHRLFSVMEKKGCAAVVMEVSSHALVLKRTCGIVFAGAVFTNLTQDHLDFHHTMDKYAAAKALLFGAVAPGGFVVVNADDPWAGYMAENRGKALLSCCTLGGKRYSCKDGKEFRAAVVEAGLRQTTVRITAGEEIYESFFPLPGLYNVMNLLEVFASALALGLKPETVVRCLSSASPVKGRMEIISDAAGERSAFVDYAHTPDALQKVIDTINSLKPEKAALVVVFGCGGNRDKEKRAKMGSIAAKGCDRVIITSDNPRDENPESILDEIAEGIESASYLRFCDRSEAIRAGVNRLEKGDVLLVAGKGDEAYQETSGVRRRFSDQETVREALFARTGCEEKEGVLKR